MNVRNALATLLLGVLTVVLLLVTVSAANGALPASQASPPASPPAEALSIELRGLFIEPRSITLDDLRTLPVETVETTYITEAGIEETHTFTGVRLWDALQDFGIALDPTVAEAALDKYIVLTARDGSVVVISLGEIHPDLGGQPYLLAWEKDGEALPEDQQPLLLVTPGDSTEGRYIYGLAAIDIRVAEPAPTG